MFIDLINAKKIYGKGESEVRALDGASLQLDEGLCISLAVRAPGGGKAV